MRQARWGYLQPFGRMHSMTSELEQLPEDLVLRWKAQLAINKEEADNFYFAEVLPPLLAILEQRPAHRLLRAEAVHVLVSLMGFSPETTVICAAILRPQSLVVVLSERAEHSYDRAHEYLTAHKILRPSQIERVIIPPTDPRAIYNEIRQALSRAVDNRGTPRKRIFDVTGGKKIMSASAGQVAWEADWPLCYIDDGGTYDANLRRPPPGHEQLILLPSPTQRHAEDARRTALEKYASRNYAAASEAFDKSRSIRPENRLDYFAYYLCQCYRSWADLNLPALATNLEQLSLRMAEPRIADLLRSRKQNLSRLEAHLSALERVARGEDLSLVATFLELAALYRASDRHDFACLLAYRGMEEIVDHGLKALAGAGFDRGTPRYELLGDREALEARFGALCGKLGGRGKHVLPSKIGFIDGLILLCLVDRIYERLPRPMVETSFIQMLRGEAERRNASVLAHGDRTLTEADSRIIVSKAEELAKCTLKVEEFERFQALRADLGPLSLELLIPPGEV